MFMAEKYTVWQRLRKNHFSGQYEVVQQFYARNGDNPFPNMPKENLRTISGLTEEQVLFQYPRAERFSSVLNRPARQEGEEERNGELEETILVVEHLHSLAD